MKAAFIDIDSIPYHDYSTSSIYFSSYYIETGKIWIHWRNSTTIFFIRILFLNNIYWIWRDWNVRLCQFHNRISFHKMNISRIVTDRMGKVTFSEAFVCPRRGVRSLDGDPSWMVRILLECILVDVVFEDTFCGSRRTFEYFVISTKLPILSMLAWTVFTTAKRLSSVRFTLMMTGSRV